MFISSTENSRNVFAVSKFYFVMFKYYFIIWSDY